MDYQKLFEFLLGQTLKPNHKGEAKVRCPLHHPDHNPSFNANTIEGVWFCHPCGKGGNIYQLAQILGKTIDGDCSVNQSQNAMKQAPSRRETLLGEVVEWYYKQRSRHKGNAANTYLNSKKLTAEVCNQFRLGFAQGSHLTGYLLKKNFTLEESIDVGVTVMRNNRPMDFFHNALILPVWKDGQVVNLVARQLGENPKPKYLNLKGPIDHFFNEDILVGASEVIICEGIVDTLTLIQRGLSAVGTLGAGLFKEEFKAKFRDKQEKYVVLDNDPAGISGTFKIGEIFEGNIKVIGLPPGLDVNDFFLTHGLSDFNARKESADWFPKFHIGQMPAEEIHLLDIENAKYIGKKIKTIFITAGVGTVYFVPFRFKVFYTEASEKGKGSVLHERTLIIPSNHTILLKMCKVDKETQFRDLKGYAKSQLGSSLKIEGIKPQEYISITEMIALPKIKELTVGASGKIIADDGKEYRQKVVSFQGAKNTTSKAYKAEGYVVADPKTSEARLIVTDYTEIKEDFDDFKVTKETIRRFRTWQKKECESIEDHLNYFIESVQYYIVRIFGDSRKDAILANLLCFFSPLYFNLEDELINGWLQIACIGDTTTGKSRIAKSIRGYSDIGVYVTGETCSRTGFLYAIDTKTLSTCVLRWGLLPQQDRSLLIIDGGNYIPKEDWGTAREARRSGILKIERVVRGEHPCRARLIILANPPKALKEYMNPIEAIKDFLDEPDIARLDLCVLFGLDDVAKEEINIPQEDRPKPRMVMDKKTFRESIFWAWTRTAKDIEIDRHTVLVINEEAINLLEKFGSATDIPIIGNDVKYKIARLSVAFACLLHNTDEEHQKVFVTREIVHAVARYIERIYSSNNCRLSLYAQDRKEKTDITPGEVEVIEQALKSEKEKDRSNILEEMFELIRKNQRIPLSDICAKLEKSQSTIKSKLFFFRRFGLIRSGKTGYTKTPKFIQFLNKRYKQVQKKALPSLSSHEKVTPLKKIKVVLKKKGVMFFEVHKDGEANV